MHFSRSLRSRSGDWGHTVRDLTRGDILTLVVVEDLAGLLQDTADTADTADPIDTADTIDTADSKDAHA